MLIKTLPTTLLQKNLENHFQFQCDCQKCYRSRQQFLVELLSINGLKQMTCNKSQVWHMWILIPPIEGADGLFTYVDYMKKMCAMWKQQCTFICCLLLIVFEMDIGVVHNILLIDCNLFTSGRSHWEWITKLYSSGNLKGQLDEWIEL